ncbi:MAG: valine--tRNA ligase [Saprospiraceae bacterium]
MELGSRYTPLGIEEKWYKHWEDLNYFHSIPDEREPFTIVIPPPNITGVLHMGHMLNITIQDILIRRARLQGKNACWVPGTDHASIATEAKVVRMLRDQGIKKSDISREEFLNYAFEWKEKYGGLILQQLRRLGASCDWERTAFTMDEKRSEAVIKAFVDLYHRGKLYRGKRMVNWDCEAKTVLSNEEVLYKEEQAQLFNIKYISQHDPNSSIVIATQRPETIMADAAIAIHPEDPRYRHLIGTKVIIPLINRAIPIIEDTYVDIEFGTGALKVTPAHDQNDYEIGVRHKLEIVDILNDDGTLNSNAKILVGEDRFTARKKIKSLLEEANVLVSIQDYKTSIGRSERTHSVVEPKLSLQWYVDSKQLSEPALKAVMESEIEFLPDHMKNTYRHWMENIRDWCISRQLWWGHRVPAYYYGEEIFVAETKEEAIHLAIEKIGISNFNPVLLFQDEDVLDTWFSSWLWPISVFDGFNNSKDFQYYYPSNVLVTGWDIIFLWVARMIMAGYEWKNAKPFKQVYFTGMVRDKQRRKMSKSLGNSPDALELINEYGADGVRFGMLSSSPAGGDLLFDEKLCDQGRSFCNKLWNATRLIQSWKSSSIDAKDYETLVMSWMNDRITEIYIESDKLIEQSRLSEALKLIYSFIWEDFCGFYLEALKPQESSNISQEVYLNTIGYYERICTLLHPFTPFITEEIWHQLKTRQAREDCMMSSYEQIRIVDKKLLETISEVRNITTNVRELRSKHSIKMNVELPLYVQQSNIDNVLLTKGAKSLLIKMARLSDCTEVISEVAHTQSFIGMRHKYYVLMPITIDVQAEKQRLLKDIEYAQGFVGSIEKKLSNDRFRTNAPGALIEKELRKLEDGRIRLQSLKESLNSLNADL